MSIALKVIKDAPVFFKREGRWGGGGAEKLSLENMSLKHIQSTPGNSNETFKGNKQRFEFSETREK